VLFQIVVDLGGHSRCEPALPCIDLDEAIWLARNRATFEKKMIKSPFEIVFTVVSFLLYWAGLQARDDVKQLRAGAEMIRNGTLMLMRACDATTTIGE
jgi:hypothetical protein